MAVLFSGGRDSTIAVDLLSRADPQSEVHVVFCDTGCEFPWIRTHAYSVLSRVADRWDVHVVAPEPHDLFWRCVFEKGYPAPHADFRWHVRRVLVNPVRQFLERLSPDVVVMGSRLEELPDAKRVELSSRVVGGVGTGYHNPTGIPAVFPVATFSSADCTRYLLRMGERFLARLYSVPPDLRSAFGGAVPRSGCWLCRDAGYRAHFYLAVKYGVFPARRLWEYATWFWEESLKPENRLVDESGVPRRLSPEFRSLARERFESLRSDLDAQLPGVLL